MNRVVACASHAFTAAESKMENHRAGGHCVNLCNFVFLGGVMGATLRIGDRSPQFDIYSWGDFSKGNALVDGYAKLCLCFAMFQA